MTSSKKPFFYSKDLKPWERWVISIYLIITVALGIWYGADSNAREPILFFVAVGTQLGMYFGLYTSLRNLKSYLIWCGVGLFHLTLYFLLKDDPSLQMARGHAATGLRNTIVLLLLFQLLRYFSLKLQHREFVAPAHGGGKDLFENKKVTVVDFGLLILYLAAWGGLSFLTIK